MKAQRGQFRHTDQAPGAQITLCQSATNGLRGCEQASRRLGRALRKRFANRINGPVRNRVRQAQKGSRLRQDIAQVIQAPVLANQIK